MLGIKNLKAKWLRGIVETDLEFNGKSVILFGENGQGKSSFVDALEFLFKGQVSYLDEAQTTSTSRHVPHISSDKKNCEVEIEFQDGSKITRNFKEGLSQVPTHIQSYFQQGVESPFILRRKYLLDFILAQPAPRYEKLAALVRISDLENVELSFMRKRDQLKEEVERIQYNLKEIQQQSEKLLGRVIESEEQLLALLNEKLKSYRQPPLKSFDEIAKRKTDAISSAKSHQEMTKASEVSKAIGIVEQLKNELATFEKHKVFWDKVSNVQQDKEKLKELMFKQLLEQGQNLIKQIDWTKCPLCLQPIDRDEILRSIEARLRSLEHITKQMGEIKTVRLSLQEDLKEMWDNIEMLVNALKKTGYTGDLRVLINLKEELKKLNDDVSLDPVFMKMKPFEEVRKEIFDDEIGKFLQGDAFNWLKNEQQKLTPTEKDKITVQIIDLLTKSAEIKEKFAELSGKLKAKERVAGQVDNIYKCFLETKHLEVQKIYDSLQTAFTRYYQILHLGEEHRDIKLVVKPERRGSAEIRSTFYNRTDEDPRGFNSEAHLDSLGLCIFLAFIKNFNKNFPLIVLDDVIFSIDATHRNRVSDLIYKEFAEYQFLITTHDYIWFEELCSAQRAFKVESKFRNLKIVRWSLNEGPIIDKYKPKWEEIQEKINAGDREGAARESRRCLEWLCQEMCVNLRASVQIKRDNKYEVGDLYRPFVDRVKKLLPEYYKDNEPAFQQLEKNIIFGNILSHNNPTTGNVSINEVKDFVDSLKGVHDLFFCFECSSLVQYYQTAGLIKCECGKKRWDTK